MFKLSMDGVVYPWPYPREQGYGDQHQSPEKLSKDKGYVDLTELMLDVQRAREGQKSELAEWKVRIKESLGKFAQVNGWPDSAIDRWISDLLFKAGIEQDDLGAAQKPAPAHATKINVSQNLQNALASKWNEEWSQLFGEKGNPPFDVIEKIDGSTFEESSFQRLDIETLTQEAWDRYLATRFRRAIIAAIKHPWKAEIIACGLPYELPALALRAETRAAELRMMEHPIITEVLIKEYAFDQSGKTAEQFIEAISEKRDSV